MNQEQIIKNYLSILNNIYKNNENPNIERDLTKYQIKNLVKELKEDDRISEDHKITINDNIFSLNSLL